MEFCFDEEYLLSDLAVNEYCYSRSMLLETYRVRNVHEGNHFLRVSVPTNPSIISCAVHVLC